MSQKLLFLSFNGHTFYKLSDIITHIHDYHVGLQHVKLYYDVVEQVVALFDVGLVFAAGLIKAIMKDKSWTFVDWDAKNLAELLEPLIYHHKVALDGQNCRKKASRLINKH